MRVATYNTELDRDGPGLLLRDIHRGDEHATAVANVIAHVAPDVIVLQRFDFDHELHTLNALAQLLSDRGAPYPYLFALRPNTGLQTGYDLNGNGWLGDSQDAQGYGEFSGQKGMAILSKLPIDTDHVRDFSHLKITEIPTLRHVGATSVLRRYDFWRLSSVAHWDLPVHLPGGAVVHLLAWHGSTPAFDGPEDRNGQRGGLEALFWADYLDGLLPALPPAAPVIVLGTANIDPADGDGWNEAVQTLLNHPRLQDPKPQSKGGTAAAADQGGVNSGHSGNPAQDTADWPDAPGDPGNLRVSYILPDRSLRVVDAGVFWPVTGPLTEMVQAASRHRLVWVDLVLPTTD